MVPRHKEARLNGTKFLKKEYYEMLSDDDGGDGTGERSSHDKYGG